MALVMAYHQEPKLFVNDTSIRLVAQKQPFAGFLENRGS